MASKTTIVGCGLVCPENESLMIFKVPKIFFFTILETKIQTICFNID